MKTVSAVMLLALLWTTTARAQQAQQICIPITSNASGVSVTSCVPVSTSNPFPTRAQ